MTHTEEQLPFEVFSLFPMPIYKTNIGREFTKQEQDEFDGIISEDLEERTTDQLYEFLHLPVSHTGQRRLIGMSPPHPFRSTNKKNKPPRFRKRLPVALEDLPLPMACGPTESYQLYIYIYIHTYIYTYIYNVNMT